MHELERIEHALTNKDSIRHSVSSVHRPPMLRWAEPDMVDSICRTSAT